MQTENKYEQLYWQKNLTLVGIDEAGRGPLAGPLAVAGVVFPIGYDSKEIYDSKALTEKKREELYPIIIRDALFYQIELVDEATIDRLNILEATRQAMSKIALAAPTNIVLTDAMKLPIDKEVTDLIKGDQKSCSIAAASILAKVTRDRIMMELDQQYPQYNFKKNKGYPTAEHIQALEEHGVSPVHRKSYGPVKNAMQGKLF